VRLGRNTTRSGEGQEREQASDAFLLYGRAREEIHKDLVKKRQPA
jgi:hypothetical protein